MNPKLILSGIVLIALLVACTERNDEETAALQPQNINKIDVKKLNTEKIVRDSIKTPEIQNDSNLKDGPATNETIDPTKPDRPK